jgi:hypothetical protein
MKFGPINTNGATPLHVSQQLVRSLPNSQMFWKLIKAAALFPGAPTFILITCYTQEHATGIVATWNSTRAPAHTSITVEFAGQGN